MVLSNDATALILTPVVYVLVTKLRLPVLPFLFACTFIADTPLLCYRSVIRSISFSFLIPAGSVDVLAPVIPAQRYRYRD